MISIILPIPSTAIYLLILPLIMQGISKTSSISKTLSLTLVSVSTSSTVTSMC